MTDAAGFGLALQHTTLVVSDFERSKRFYMEVLGLEDLHADFLPDKQMFLGAGRNLEVHIGEVPGFGVGPHDFNHVAFSVQDFDGFLEHLEEHGVVYGSLGGSGDHQVQMRPDGVRQAFFQDPDGYWLEANDAG